MKVVERLSAVQETFVPSVVLGELYYGAMKSARPKPNLARIDEFADATAILVCGLGTAQLYGQIKNSLRSSGRPIPENDIWIAAIALEHKLTLATRDKHFEVIEGLLHECW